MLTTEQKINLLILAGFEPKSWGVSHTEPRIGKIGSKAVLYRAGTDAMFVWEFNISYGHKEYIPSSWDAMKLDTCPDELIYKAIES